MNGRTLLRIVLAVAAAPFLCCGCGYGCSVLTSIPDNRMQRLLEGDHELELRSIAIRGQGEHIEISDAESLQYLTRAFRGAVNEGYLPTNHGSRYRASLRVASFGWSSVDFEVLDGKEGVNIGYIKSALDDPTYYWIALPEPRPAPITDALDRFVRAGKR